MPERITLRVRVEAVGYDVIDNLIASGDLAPAVRDVFTVLDVGPTLEWTKADLSPTNPHSYLDRVTNQRVFCATDTNLNVTADRFPQAPARSAARSTGLAREIWGHHTQLLMQSS